MAQILRETIGMCPGVDHSHRLSTGLGCITLGGEGEARVVTVRTISSLSKLSECHLAISARLVAN